MKKILLPFVAIALMVLGAKAQTTIIIKGSTSNPVAGQTVWINYSGIPTTCNVQDTTITDSAGNFLYTLNLASGCNFGRLYTNIIGCRYDTLVASFTHDSTVKNNDTAYMNMVYCVGKGPCTGFTADFKTADSCGTVYFFNSSSSNANMFSWSLGNGLSSTVKDPVTTFSSSGTYTACLVVKDTILGCADSICQSVTLAGQLTGTIYRDSSQVADSGWVYLIEISIDRNGDTVLTAVDSTIFFYGGYYNFRNVPTGSYLIKAALAPGSAYYANRLPTYYGQSALWSGATTVNVNGCTNKNITLLTGTNSGGSGFIGGLVSQGANKAGDPLGQIHVVLFTVDNKPVAVQYTDANGNYKFSNLAFGNYKVIVDVLGKPSEEYLVTLSATNANDNNGNFDVNTKDVVVVKKSSTSIAPIDVALLKLYPNPAANQITLAFDAIQDGTTSINVMDISGRLVQQQNIQTTVGSNTTLLDVSNLQSGIYFVNIKVGDSNYITRLSVNR